MIIKVLCKFTIEGLRFATQNTQDSSGNWKNKIINISSLSRNIGEDKSYEVSGISIEFNDTDRYFRTLMSSTDRFIAGKKVELSTEDNELIYTGVVEKWVFKEDSFQLHINDRLSGLESMVPKSISITEYPNLTEKAEGASIPIIYGTLYASQGAVKCWRVDTVTINSVEKGLEAIEWDIDAQRDGVSMGLEGDILVRGFIPTDNEKDIIVDYMEVLG
jgi:hypothetical protein